MTIEVYYGYCEGDAQVWDTIVVPITKAKPKGQFKKEYAIQTALKELEKAGIEPLFFGIFAVDKEKED